MPAAQDVTVLPPGQKAPAGQAWQVLALVAPVAVEYVPAGQVLTVTASGHHAPAGQPLHPVAPLVSATVPGGQAVHPDAQVEGEYVPVGQSLQKLSPAPEYLPAGQQGQVHWPVR